VSSIVFVSDGTISCWYEWLELHRTSYRSEMKVGYSISISSWMCCILVLCADRDIKSGIRKICRGALPSRFSSGYWFFLEPFSTDAHPCLSLSQCILALIAIAVFSQGAASSLSILHRNLPCPPSRNVSVQLVLAVSRGVCTSLDTSCRYLSMIT